MTKNGYVGIRSEKKTSNIAKNEILINMQDTLNLIFVKTNHFMFTKVHFYDLHIVEKVTIAKKNTSVITLVFSSAKNNFIYCEQEITKVFSS